MMRFWDKLKSIFTTEKASGTSADQSKSGYTLGDLIRERADSRSGESISPEAAMRQETVYSCVNLISNSIAQLPLIVYRDLEDEGKIPAKDLDLYELLHDSPNNYQTPIEFKSFMIAAMLLRGISAAYITRVGRKIKALTPIPPDCFEEVWDDLNYDHYYRAVIKGRSRRLDRSEVLVCKGLTIDGKRAVSPIAYAARMINTSIEASRYNGDFYRNGARPSGLLMTPEVLKKDKISEMSEGWQRNYGGSNRGKIAILSGGLTYQPVAMSNSDAQLLQTLGFSRDQICAIYGVPPFLVGGTETSTSWGTGMKEQRNNLLTFTLSPWITRLEEAIRRDLITKDQRKTERISVEAQTKGFLRADTSSRYEAYKTSLGGTQAPGFMTQNEVRRLENLPRVEGGDILFQPVFKEDPKTDLPEDQKSKDEEAK